MPIHKVVADQYLDATLDDIGAALQHWSWDSLDKVLSPVDGAGWHDVSLHIHEREVTIRENGEDKQTAERMADNDDQTWVVDEPGYFLRYSCDAAGGSGYLMMLVKYQADADDPRPDRHIALLGGATSSSSTIPSGAHGWAMEDEQGAAWVPATVWVPRQADGSASGNRLVAPGGGHVLVPAPLSTGPYRGVLPTDGIMTVWGRAGDTYPVADWGGVMFTVNDGSQDWILCPTDLSYGFDDVTFAARFDGFGYGFD